MWITPLNRCINHKLSTILMQKRQVIHNLPCFLSFYPPHSRYFISFSYSQPPYIFPFSQRKTDGNYTTHAVPNNFQSTNTKKCAVTVCPQSAFLLFHIRLFTCFLQAHKLLIDACGNTPNLRRVHLRTFPFDVYLQHGKADYVYFE